MERAARGPPTKSLLCVRAGVSREVLGSEEHTSSPTGSPCLSKATRDPCFKPTTKTGWPLPLPADLPLPRQCPLGPLGCFQECLAPAQTRSMAWLPHQPGDLGTHINSAFVSDKEGGKQNSSSSLRRVRAHSRKTEQTERVRGGLDRQLTFPPVLTLPLTSCGHWGKFCLSAGLSFLTYKMGITLIVPASLECYKD